MLVATKPVYGKLLSAPKAFQVAVLDLPLKPDVVVRVSGNTPLNKGDKLTVVGISGVNKLNIYVNGKLYSPNTPIAATGNYQVDVRCVSLPSPPHHP